MVFFGWQLQMICKQSAPCSRQIIIPTLHHSIFLAPESIEGNASVFSNVLTV